MCKMVERPAILNDSETVSLKEKQLFRFWFSREGKKMDGIWNEHSNNMDGFGENAKEATLRKFWHV